MTHPQALLLQLGFADPAAALRLPLPPAAALRIALGARLAARGGTVQDSPSGLLAFHPIGSRAAAGLLVQTAIELLTEGTQGLAEDTPPVALRGLVIGIGSDTEVARAEAMERAQTVMPLLRDHGLLVSREVYEALPAALREHCRLAAPPSLVDTQPRFRDLFELGWQLIDVRLSEIDRIAPEERPQPEMALPPPPEARLALSHGKTELELTPGDCPLLLGRDKSCGLRLDGDVASRIHARIEFHHGRFYFVDDSRNGSYLLTPQGDDVFVHRQRLPLMGRGVISAGATLVKQTGELVHYRCLADTDYGAAVESSSFASV